MAVESVPLDAAPRPIVAYATPACTPLSQALLAWYAGQKLGRPPAQLVPCSDALGLTALRDGVADVVFVRRYLSPVEQARLSAVVLARAAVVPIVHPVNPVRNLTTAQALALFAKGFKRWQPVGGFDFPVTLVQSPNEAVIDVLQRVWAMNPQQLPAQIKVPSAELAMTNVLANVQAIGVVPVQLVWAAEAAERPLGIVRVNGEAPTREAILSNRYPWTIPVVAVVRTPVHPDLVDLLRALATFAAAPIYEEYQLVPLSRMD